MTLWPEGVVCGAWLSSLPSCGKHLASGTHFLVTPSWEEGGCLLERGAGSFWYSVSALKAETHHCWRLGLRVCHLPRLQAAQKCPKAAPLAEQFLFPTCMVELRSSFCPPLSSGRSGQVSAQLLKVKPEAEQARRLPGLLAAWGSLPQLLCPRSHVSQERSDFRVGLACLGRDLPLPGSGQRARRRRAESCPSPSHKGVASPAPPSRAGRQPAVILLPAPVLCHPQLPPLSLSVPVLFPAHVP